MPSGYEIMLTLPKIYLSSIVLICANFLGGLLNKADLAAYEARIERPHTIPLPIGFTIKGSTSPSSFSAIALVVEILMGMIPLSIVVFL